MNPFELSGPSFLAVYGIFAAALLGLLALLRSRAERPRDGGLNLANAYEIAYLRGGAEEALGAAVASLLDRRLLWSEGLRLRAAPGALETTTDPVERAILSRTSDSEKASRLLADPGLKQVARAAHHGGLVDEGLLPSAQQLSARLRASAVVLVLLFGSAIYKVALALQRGRHNVGFLILLALLACGLTLRSLLGRRTRAGDQRLAALRTLYAGLKGRAWNGRSCPGARRPSSPCWSLCSDPRCSRATSSRRRDACWALTHPRATEATIAVQPPLRGAAGAEAEGAEAEAADAEEEAGAEADVEAAAHEHR